MSFPSGVGYHIYLIYSVSLRHDGPNINYMQIFIGFEAVAVAQRHIVFVNAVVVSSISIWGYRSVMFPLPTLLSAAYRMKF